MPAKQSLSAAQALLLSTPIDFDQLTADGVLLPLADGWYRVPEVVRLPAHALARISDMRVSGGGHKNGPVTDLKFEGAACDRCPGDSNA